MILAPILSQRIVAVSLSYLGTPFDWDTFNCVHFVRAVYSDVGIILPILVRHLPPPDNFHLSGDEFESIPPGHSVFFKRKAKFTSRPWSHLAIVVDSTTLIHCTRHMGTGVMLSSKSDFLDIYNLVPKST